MGQVTFALLLSMVAALPLAAAPSDAVLIEFGSPQCSPCRAMQPVVRQLEDAGVPVRHVDVGRERDLAVRYGVRRTPTYLVFSGGQEQARLVGVQSLADLQAALRRGTQPALTPTRSVADGPQSVPPQTRLASLEPRVEAMPSVSTADAIERARAATVRLRVFDDQGYGAGTGTIIHQHGPEALVLTCGHLFRETKGAGKIEVDVYSQGKTHTVLGQLVDYDAEHRDIALVAIRPTIPVQPVAVLAHEDVVRTGDSVFSFGCDRGADPSRRDTRITGVNKYNQHVNASNFEIAGAPIDGRSGGGLFDQQGRLIGVCNSADYKGDVGIYTGPGSIRWQLDRVDLAQLYQQSPGGPNGGPNGGSSGDPRTQFASQQTPAQSSPAAAPQTRMADLNAASPPQASSGSPRVGPQSIIVIMQEGGENRMVTVKQPSPELRSLLERELHR